MRLMLLAAALAGPAAAHAQPPAGDAPEPKAPRLEARRLEFAPPAGASLGVTLKPLTDELRKELNAKAEAGAVVAAVVPGSPAQAAGIKPDDIVTAFAGKPVKSPDDLIQLVRGSKPGSDVAVTLERDGEKVTANATLRAGALGAFGFGGGGPGLEGFAFPAFDLGALNGALDQSKKVAELEKKVADLEKRLAELEKKLDAAAKK